MTPETAHGWPPRRIATFAELCCADSQLLLHRQGRQNMLTMPVWVLIPLALLHRKGLLFLNTFCCNYTGKQSDSPAAQTQSSTLLDKLQDISNMRRSQLQLHTGSGRTVTKRTFSLAMSTVQTPEPQAATQTPAHTAFCTPQAAGSPPTASRLSAHTSRSSRASFGSAMEGVPERPWRSIPKTPAASRRTAASSMFQYTPMEGVPERLDRPALQQSIRRQSNAGKLRTPATARQSPAKQASTPVSISRPEAVLRLQLSPGELSRS